MSQGEFGIHSRILIQPEGREYPLYNGLTRFLYLSLLHEQLTCGKEEHLYALERDRFFVVTGGVSLYPCKGRVQDFHHLKKLFLCDYQGGLNSENVPVDATQSGK